MSTAPLNPVVFIRQGFITWFLSVPPTDEEVYKRTGGRIDFTHDAATGLADPRCTFATADPVLIQYINAWNKRNPGRLKTDRSAIPMRCHICDFTTQGGTPADMEAMNQHLLEHASFLEEANPGMVVAPNPKIHTVAQLKEMAVRFGADSKEVDEAKSKADVMKLIEASEAVDLTREDVEN